MAQQANLYGLDFLRTEHTLDDDGEPRAYQYSSSGSATVRTSNVKKNHHPRSSSWIGDTEALAVAAASKPLQEKIFDIIHFLQAHRSAGWMPPSVIYERTGIDLTEDDQVAGELNQNAKVRVERVPDPENPSLMISTYAYQAKYNNVRDRKTLLAQINRSVYGVSVKDLSDAYDGVQDDMAALITAGDVLALSNNEDKDKILFPRGEPFIVELDGIVTIPEWGTKKKKIINTNGAGIKKEDDDDDGGNDDDDNKKDDNKDLGSNKNNTEATMNGSNGDKAKEDGSGTEKKPNGGDSDAGDDNDGPAIPTTTTSLPASVASPKKVIKKKKRPPVFCVDTDSDPRSQIRRGEAIQIGGSWFRVSSAVKDGPLDVQPARAQAPLSAVSFTDLSKRNEIDGYIRPFNKKTIPVDAALPRSAMINLQKAKEARERLLKVAHGRAGGATSQLLGSFAYAANPVSLAASFGTNPAGARRRGPSKASSGGGVQRVQDTSQAKEAAMDPYLNLYAHPKRHGCTKDVRDLYLKTRSKVPSSDPALKALLLEHRLLEPGEEMRRQRLQRRNNVDNDGKPKKRRYYVIKGQRMTNVHLEGTEIGAVLRRATEKQKQGEQVGDGGM